MRGLTLRQVVDPDEEQTRQLEVIYLASFPPGERSAFLAFMQSVRRGQHLLFLASEGSMVAGFAILSRVPRVRCYLLEYLAIAPEWRNRGIGVGLLRYIRKCLQGEGEARAILLEVESPRRMDLSIEEIDLRQRRMSYYERNGAVLVDTSGAYCIPDMTDASRWIENESFDEVDPIIQW